MSVLVCGGAGYIGSHMVWALVDRGDDVVVLDDLSTGHEWLLPAECRFVNGSISDADKLQRIFETGEIDAVVHFAGSIIVPESVTNPLKYYRNNTAASLNLIEACVQFGVNSLVFSSTAAVYGDPEARLVPESARLNPLSPYGKSKLMTEMLLEDVSSAHSLNYCVLRYFNVAGADPHGRTGQVSKNATHLIKVACEAALGNRDQVSVFGTDYDTPDGTGVRDYIHVSDLIGAHLLALDYLVQGGQSRTMNCGYGAGYSVLEVLDAVKSVSGVDFPVVMCDRRLGDSEQVVADPSLIQGVLGWAPIHNDLPTIVRHALHWEASLANRNRR